MPRVFISYARHDLNHIQQLERALQAHDVSVWRDQESIYGGQQWPKAIGEAIAAHDHVVQVWSKSAAQSHFMEFEWSSTIALQKTILAVLTGPRVDASSLSHQAEISGDCQDHHHAPYHC